MSGGQIGLAPREIYRVNRIRIAQNLHIDPRIVDEWDVLTYNDYLEVQSAEKGIAILKGQIPPE